MHCAVTPSILFRMEPPSSSGSPAITSFDQLGISNIGSIREVKAISNGKDRGSPRFDRRQPSLLKQYLGKEALIALPARLSCNKLMQQPSMSITRAVDRFAVPASS